MTVIVQQPIDSNGNPQPMVYDSDTKKIIVDSNGFVVSIAVLYIDSNLASTVTFPVIQVHLLE